MKRIMMALLAGGVGLGLARAQEMAPAKQPEMRMQMKAEKKAVKKEKLKVCKGTVEAVDPALGTLTVKDKKGKVMVMPIAPETKIRKAGKPAALAEILAGEKVHIVYRGAMENPMVKSVKVSKPRMKDKGMKKGPKIEEPQM